jgi:hypothetical protein
LNATADSYRPKRKSSAPSTVSARSNFGINSAAIALNVIPLPPKPRANWQLGFSGVEPMLWEAKTPYLYTRITSDRRLIVGGEAENFHSPAKRDASSERKTRVIEKKLRLLKTGLDADWLITQKSRGLASSSKQFIA